MTEERCVGMSFVHRTPQTVLIVSTLATSWLLMQAVHELGHVLAGLMTGAEVRRVILQPLTISRTDFGANPSPLIACWGGPVFGAFAPLLLWWLARWRRLKCQFQLKFFAGFCLIANGSYLAVGVAEGIGDAGDLMRHGSAPWMLYLFGAATIPMGLWFWHGLGPQFGLGAHREPISWRAAAWSLVVLLVTILIEVALG